MTLVNVIFIACERETAPGSITRRRHLSGTPGVGIVVEVTRVQGVRLIDSVVDAERSLMVVEERRGRTGDAAGRHVESLAIKSEACAWDRLRSVPPGGYLTSAWTCGRLPAAAAEDLPAGLGRSADQSKA